MISAKPFVPKRSVRDAVRCARRPVALAVTLAGCCAGVGCETVSKQLAFLSPRSQVSGESIASDPFNQAERAMAAASQSTRSAGGEGRVSLDGPIRTVSLDGARTAARPAEVTRVDPTVSPRPAAGRWQAGEGSDDTAVVRTSRPVTPPDAGSAK
ncbi:hypothetical protein, partial [Alienimonas chondri]|uniref:hypothetical protein n=1 Tax=Alienimonas chondri TaxID=2681879 RepID=UPI0014895ABA